MSSHQHLALSTAVQPQGFLFCLSVFCSVVLTNWLIISSSVHVSKPVLSVVGGTLILGKPFQLLCHSDNGTLPITYVLHSPKQPPLYSVVHKPGERAIFNLSAINKISDINTFICHGKNSQHKTSVTETGHLLRSTNIIGALDAGMATKH